MSSTVIQPSAYEGMNYSFNMLTDNIWRDELQAAHTGAISSNVNTGSCLAIEHKINLGRASSKM